MNQVLHSKSWTKDPERTPTDLAQVAGKAVELDRVIATHANASGEVLLTLSKSSDKTTRRHVALHPNTPKSALISLATQFPGEFFRNPAFDLLLLEDPQLLFKIGGGVLKNILKRPDCPFSFLTWAVEHGEEDQKLAVAMNPNAPEDLLQALADQGGSLAEAASAHAKLNSQVGLAEAEQAFLDCVHKSLSELSVEEARSMWRKASIGPSQWLWLQPKVRLAVPIGYGWSIPSEFASAPSLRDGSAVDAVGLGAHSNEPLEYLDALARHPSPTARCRAARHPSTSKANLVALATDQDRDVRFAVACNPNTPEEVLRELSLEKSGGVKEGVARNVAAPPDLLQRLLEEGSTDIRWALANNPNSPKEVLRELSLDEGLLSPWGGERVRDGVAGNPAAPGEVLIRLCNEASLVTRLALAKNPSTPLEVLQRLARIKHDKVMAALAENPGCPRSLVHLSAALRWRHDFTKLAKTLCVDTTSFLPSLDKDESVVEEFRRECLRVSANPQESLLAKLIKAEDGQALSLHSEHTRSACRSKHVVLLLRGLRHPAADPLELVRSHVSTDWKVRLAIAGNVAASESVLEKLARDSNQLVALQATATKKLKADKAEARIALLKSDGALDLGPLAQEICHRLRREWPWEDRLIGEPWWSRLTFSQRGGGTLDFPIYLEWREELRLIEGLVRDPNTPALRLPADEPTQLLEGTIDCLSRSPVYRHRVEAAAYKHASPEILKRLARDRNGLVRDTVASNPSTPPEVLIALSRLNDPNDRFAIARNRSTPNSALESLVKHADSRLLLSAATKEVPWIEAGIISAVAENPSASEQLRMATLERMVTHDSKKAREFAAESQLTPPHLLAALCRDPEVKVRAAAAANVATPAVALAELAMDEDVAIHRALAGNINTPSEALRVLSGDKSVEVRAILATNPACPADVLDLLSRDTADRVLISIVRNEGASETLRKATLVELAGKYGAGQLEAARNKLTPLEALWHLSGSNEIGVVSAVLENDASTTNLRVTAMGRLVDFKGHSAWNGWRLAASQVDAPVAVLNRLAQVDDEQTLINLVSNSSTPADTKYSLLVRLSESSNLLARKAFAANPSAPLHLLVRMGNREFWPVRATAIQNPSFPSELREAAHRSLVDEILASVEPPRPFSGDELRIENFSEPLQGLALMPDGGDKKAISRAARAKDWVQRAAACLCPAITEAALNRLLDDEVEMVKALAIWRLKALTQ